MTTGTYHVDIHTRPPSRHGNKPPGHRHTSVKRTYVVGHALCIPIREKPRQATTDTHHVEIHTCPPSRHDNKPPGHRHTSVKRTYVRLVVVKTTSSAVRRFVADDPVDGGDARDVVLRADVVQHQSATDRDTVALPTTTYNVTV